MLLLYAKHAKKQSYFFAIAFLRIFNQ